MSYLFNQVQQIHAIQEKEKLNGLNDYNPLSVIRNPYSEVGMHSNMIYSLLNPNGLHYQKDLFLNLFIKYVLKDIEDIGTNLTVAMEEQTNENRRIDFTIKSEKYFIGIEMKVEAGDLKEQTYHYYQYLKEEAKKDNNQNVIIFYLTKDGKEPSLFSRCKGSDCIDVKCISFQKEILDWISASQYQVKSIDNLFSSLKYYKEIVKKITSQYSSNIKPLFQYMIEDEQLFKEAQKFYHDNENNYKQITGIESEVYQAYTQARNKITQDFFTKILPKYLEENLSNPSINLHCKHQPFSYKLEINSQIIFASEEHNNSSKDYLIINEEKRFTKYRYRFAQSTVNDFYLNNGYNACNYYLNLINSVLEK